MVALQDGRIGAYCGIVGADDDAESQANARLIAAAPEMLEALEALRGCIMETRGPDARNALEMADAAIAKAKGGADE